MANHDASLSIPLTEVPETWSLLSEQLDAFVKAWESAGEPPDISSYLPDTPAARRKLVLVELIKTDFEYRRKRDQSAWVEDYLVRFPELSDGGLPTDLVMEEFHVRKNAGEDVLPDEYFVRFPQLAESLARHFQQSDRTPSIAAGRRGRLKTSNPGDTIADFQILKLLGQGAFANVYLAWQPTLQRTVALKVSADRGSEPQTLAQLDHPNIVRVFDQRILPDQNTSLLYMTFVAGGTLSSVLEHVRALPKNRWNGEAFLGAVDAAARWNGVEPVGRTQLQERLGRMSWPALVAWIGARVAGALKYAHTKNVLHRDVKPANVLLTPEGQPQLADFNVGVSALKQPGPEAVFGGSLPYMSPEHLEALHPYLPRKPDEIDARSDVYELGMTLWELLTGQRAFPQEQFSGDLDLTIDSLLESRRSGLPAEALAAVPSDCPPEIVRVLRKSLAPNPDERYASAEEFSLDLELCLDQQAIALLRPDSGGWRAWVRRSPALWIFIIGLTPNVVASIINVHYNRATVIDARPAAEPTFWWLVNVINGVFFPLGLGVFVGAMLPVARAVRKRERGDIVPASEASAARIRCLRLGSIASRTCVACWMVAGIIWPIALDALLGTLPLDAHLHFLASLTVCGMIAAVYPFFLVSALGVRALLPSLLRNERPEPREIGEVHRLERALGRNLLFAAAVPLVSVAALVTIDMHDRTTMLSVTAIGLAGYVLAYFLDRRLRGDLAVLGRTFFA